MRDWCRRVAESTRFHRLVMVVILLNAILLGLETVPSIRDGYAATTQIAHTVIQVLFFLEITIRFLAAESIRSFVRDGWNVFDTAVVLLGILPVAGEAVTVARLARVLRIARLVEVSDEMKLIVATIVSSMKSLTKLILLIVVLLYSYAIIGYHLFHEKDPENWGSLGVSMWSLFQSMTLEGWADKQAITLSPSWIMS